MRKSIFVFQTAPPLSTGHCPYVWRVSSWFIGFLPPPKNILASVLGTVSVALHVSKWTDITFRMNFFLASSVSGIGPKFTLTLSRIKR